jgi:hypothetical protein
MSKKMLGSKLLAGLFALAAIALPDALRAEDAPGSAIHGFADLSFKNDYITPRGLMVTNKGLTTQIDGGLVFDLYSDKTGPLTDLSAVVGIWNDLYSKQGNKNFGPWNEFDWFTGLNFQFSQLTASVTFVDFISPPGNFKDEKNLEFGLSYADAGWGNFSLHPYGKLFYAISGSSTVVTGKAGGTFDVELGLVPTLNLKPYGAPITLTFPTWFTVGPQNYWGDKNNFGVFSTGIAAKTPISFIPPKFGSWTFNIGLQYYNFLNSNLLAAQVITVGGKHRDAVLASTGIGFSF